MVSKKLKGLGRGLDALMGSGESERLEQLPVGALQSGRFQPRRHFDEAALAELADSIRAQGLMQPVIVRELSAGLETRYEIVAGERRWRAAQLAGLSDIACIVRELDDSTVAAMALIENIQREDLNPLEEAEAMNRLIDEFGMTHEAVAQAVGKSRTTVTNLLRLLNLGDVTRELLVAGQLDMGHARALLVLDDAPQSDAARSVALKGLSVRETEALVKKLLAGPVVKPERQPDPQLVARQQRVAEQWGAPVEIRAGKKGTGSVVVNFRDAAQLEKLLALLAASD
ncbi:ParB/RepB/Spo0J family partition protein [Chitinibacteraceae bacterium HSL-7]